MTLGNGHLDSTPAMHELVASLLLWIGANSTLAVSPAPGPAVELVPGPVLARILFDGDVPPAFATGELRVEGAYIHEERAVYLAHDVDLATTAGRGVLLHELVHYVQLAGGTDTQVRCQAELEADAYRLQARYLAQHGERPPFSARHVAKVSRCR